MKPVDVNCLDGRRHPRSVIYHNTAGMNEGYREHLCPKPTKLVASLVGAYSKDTDLILDPFAGSGTTLVAAKQLGRKAIGIEISEAYCAIAKKRLSQEYLL
jgi:site-specific DNA-methyltransferase (adenine-specific)